jgi:hypothetical protein
MNGVLILVPLHAKASACDGLMTSYLHLYNLEHMLITVMANVSFNVGYSAYVIVVQRYIESSTL